MCMDIKGVDGFHRAVEINVPTKLQSITMTISPHDDHEQVWHLLRLPPEA